MSDTAGQIDQECHTPWVEKYRPQTLDRIVLDAQNRIFFENVICGNQLPHLLFYGPPGTGKTTTIFSILRQFMPHLKHEVLHLNASDDRGIDVIRSQIMQFVYSNTFYANAIKFVVLDEVDNMTKNAQFGLAYLLQSFPMARVRFCLICNYISKIVPTLKNEFVTVRFNQLPEEEIVRFLLGIAKEENVLASEEELRRLCRRYGSDVRSMINALQTQFPLKDGGCGDDSAQHGGGEFIGKKAAREGKPMVNGPEDAVDELLQSASKEEFLHRVFAATRRYGCSYKEVLRELFLRLIEDPSSRFLNSEDCMTMMETLMHTMHTNMDESNLRYAYYTIFRTSSASVSAL